MLRKQGEKFPDLNALLPLCKLHYYEPARALGEKDWIWNVLVPWDWPVIPNTHSTRDSGTGRRWYSGYSKGEENARGEASLVLGQALGMYISAWLGPQTPPTPATLAPIRRMEASK